MIPNARPAWFALLVLALAGIGCEQVSDNNPRGANPLPEDSNTPPTVSSTAPPTTATPSSAPEATKDKASESPAPEAPKDKGSENPAPEKKEGAGASASPAPADASGVTLQTVKFDEFLKKVANKDAKYTMVDCWATWCAPCKENFPHVVEMNKKYAGKGLAVASLSFDDPAEASQINEARKFLAEKHATFPNYVLDEPNLGGFEKLNINAIPAVFLFGPDGKEVKRFTLDDPNNQFTYDEVEETVAALLDGKPLPKKDDAKPAPDKDKASE